MAVDDRQLVKLITAQVVEVLRQRGLIGHTSGGAAAPSSTSRAEVHPPIGQCTGDYSKFPELAGKVGAPPPSAATQPATTAPSVPAMPTVALTGVITANRLQESMDAAPDGVAVLAPDARLSPLANDLARQFPQRVRRASASESMTTQDGGVKPWLAWVQGHCGVANQVISNQVGRFVGSSASQQSGALSQVVRDLAGAIRSGRVIGGVLFVPSAARAMCFLNRCSSIRAVVGTCGEAVEQGVAEIGANVLVIEYPHHGHRSMAAMVERMLQSTPTAPPSVQRDLADLQRC